MIKAKILIVDDEPIFIYSIKRMLQMCNYEVIGTADSYQSTMEKIKLSTPDLIIMDIYINGEKDGIDTVYDIHYKQKIPVIFLSSVVDPEIIERTEKLENCTFISKPEGDGFIYLLDKEIKDLLKIMIN